MPSPGLDLEAAQEKICVRLSKATVWLGQNEPWKFLRKMASDVRTEKDLTDEWTLER